MMRIFKAIVEHFGFSGIHKLIENPIATYTPCSQSALRFDVEGKDIDLSVDAENENAVGLYRSVGFDPVEEWPQWMRPRS